VTSSALQAGLGMFSQHATFQAQLGEICGAARRKIQPEPEVIGTGISFVTLN